ncbi:MAG: dual specificity protein phosphatase [Caldilinea sp.]
MPPQPPPASPDISPITEYLFISVWPEARHAEEIVQLGISLVLSMHWMPPQRALRRLPVTVLWLPTVDTPLTPMPMRTFHRGVTAALPVIEGGGKVLCHCKAGVHRSVAMAACVLIGMGFSAEDAMSTVKAGRAVADPDAAYIRRRIVKFEEVWRGS